MRLLPFKTDTYLTYKCPNPDCSGQIQQSLDEVIQIGKAVCFHCGLLMEFEKIEGVNVTYTENLSAKPVGHSIIPVNTTGVLCNPAELTEQHQEIIKGLTKLGFRKSEAKKAVDKVVSCGIIEGESENEFFNRCFNEAKK